MSLFRTILCVIAIVFAFFHLHAETTELEGNWVGYEVGRQGVWKFSVKGNECNVSTDNQSEWYEGTFTLDLHTIPKHFDLLITDCPYSPFIGVVAKAIYKLEGDSLVWAGKMPGSDYPSNFTPGLDDDGLITRVYVAFKEVSSIEKFSQYDSKISILPNPVTESAILGIFLNYNTKLKITIYNELSVKVDDVFIGYKERGIHNFIINAGNLTAGVYMLRIEAGNRVFSKKLIVIN